MSPITDDYAECFIGNKGVRVKVINGDEGKAIKNACNEISIKEAATLKESFSILKRRCECDIVPRTYDPDSPPSKLLFRNA